MADNIFQLMRDEFTSVAERVVAQMRALGPESKTSDGDEAYDVLKDPWEEYALQIQDGESFLFEVYQRQLQQICNQEIEEMEFRDLLQLWCATSESIQFEGDYISRDTMIEPVSKEVLEEVDELAKNEELPHYWAERERIDAENEAIDNSEEEVEGEEEVEEEAKYESQPASATQEDQAQSGNTPQNAHHKSDADSAQLALF